MKALTNFMLKSAIAVGTVIGLGLLSAPAQAINLTNNSTSQTSQATSSSIVLIPDPTPEYCDLILGICEWLGTGEWPEPNPNPTAVPWETDALPVIGSTILFGFGVWAKRKSAKSIQK